MRQEVFKVLLTAKTSLLENKDLKNSDKIAVAPLNGGQEPVSNEGNQSLKTLEYEFILVSTSLKTVKYAIKNRCKIPMN